MSDPTSAPPPLVRVENLAVHFPARGTLFGPRGRVVRALDGVSFDIPAGTTLGLVGESGSGKTTLARAMLRLIPATSGRVCFDGTNVLTLARDDLRRLRRQMQLVFQDPQGSLNPRLTIETIVGEALTVHRLVTGARQRRERVAALLTRVGLSGDALDRYPHEFSGGQRQRIGIARALALEPRFIICDEPVSALDVSIQSQILNLLTDLQGELHLTYLFIAHNLAVIRHCSHVVAVMYLGKIVEFAPAAELYARPAHPYTRALLAAAPELAVAGGTSDGRNRQSAPQLRGEPPSPLDVPAGCPFHPRCAFAQPACGEDPAPLTQHARLAPGHLAACHYAEQVAAAPAPTLP